MSGLFLQYYSAGLQVGVEKSLWAHPAHSSFQKVPFPFCALPLSSSFLCNLKFENSDSSFNEKRKFPQFDWASLLWWPQMLPCLLPQLETFYPGGGGVVGSTFLLVSCSWGWASFGGVGTGWISQREHLKVSLFIVLWNHNTLPFS